MNRGMTDKGQWLVGFCFHPIKRDTVVPEEVDLLVARRSRLGVLTTRVMMMVNNRWYDPVNSEISEAKGMWDWYSNITPNIDYGLKMVSKRKLRINNRLNQIERARSNQE